MTEHVIQLDRVVKRYGKVCALDGATLDVPRGTIFGFLGPNGAGKTTALRTMMGFLRATSGTLLVLGQDPWRDRVQLHTRIGYLPGGMGFYERMTGRDLLEYTASLMQSDARRSPLRARTLDALAFADATLDRRIGHYSKGMRQKLAIVQAMQHDPELLLLDEPSEGLDPLVQHSFYELLRERRDAGCTVFFSSHTLSEVQVLCDRLAIIRAGKVVASTTYEELAHRHPRVVRLTGLAGGEGALAALPPSWRIVNRAGAELTLHTTAIPTDIVTTLSGFEFEDVTIEPPSLEDVFLGFYDDDAETGA
jgi:ABC-2 type transport system ATP-binding protein